MVNPFTASLLKGASGERVREVLIDRVSSAHTVAMSGERGSSHSIGKW